MKISFTNKQWISAAAVVVLLLIWKLLAVCFDSGFVVPHPEKTLLMVGKLFVDKDFASIIGSTVFRGMLGFACSFVLGMALGIVAGISPGFQAFLNPILVTIRSVPVISLILLALIWLSPGSVPVFIAMLTMFPFICTNVIEGIKSVDPDLIGMARFYKIHPGRIVREVYIPAILPFIISGTSSAMGIGWRAIIIGEVLSQPTYGIGTMMQSAQTFLNVEAVIAWTLIAVVISTLFEWLIRWTEKRMLTWKN
ncbi:MAG TPA: ABC transporter permease [Prolixibacteraceae bacterium]|nr:ABC transporter permease [Prolixibacteraceae bacterium]